MRFQKLLWIILFASIISLLPSMLVRVSNENINNSVILAINYEGYTIGNGSSILSSAEYKRLKASGLSAIIISADEIVAADDSSDINKNIYDDLQKNGFKIIMHLESLEHPQYFYRELASAVKKYNVNSLLVCPDLHAQTKPAIGNDAGEASDPSVSYLAQIINTNGLTVFLMENKDQTGLVYLPFSDQLIAGTDYKINRAFSIHNSLVQSANPDETTYIWLRSVVDRNIRLVVTNPEDLTGGYSSLHSQTGLSAIAGFQPYLSSVSRLHSLLTERGFDTSSPLKPLNTSIPDIFQKTAVIINLITAIALYLSYLPWGRKENAIKLFTTAFLILALSALLIFYEFGGVGGAFAAALIYPSLASLLMLKYLTSQSAGQSNYIIKTAISLLIIISICLAGAAVIISSMSDIRYIMHLINFNIVTPAYAIPLLVFAVNYSVVCMKRAHKFHSANFIKDLPINLLYTFIIIAALFLYFERNGNFNLLPASHFELEVRKLLELTFYARPRTKEFMIGYPCLFIFIYIFKKEVPARLTFTVGLFSAITSISILNSFCHGFTPAAVSLARSAAGLLLGISSGIFSILLLKLFFTIKPLYNRHM